MKTILHWMFLASLVPLCACQQAHQYQAVPKKADAKVEAKADDDDPFRYRLSWIEPAVRQDTPIVFVSETSAEWQSLPAYWNEPPPATGMPTVHIGLSPLGAVAALAFSESSVVIKIKVPRGLPDPTPNFPPTNPPGYAKWKLGKALFFTELLQVGSQKFACATCHDPKQGFTEDRPHSQGGQYNALTLLNVAYNRRQFWDGRVRTLEETIFRGVDDERPLTDEQRREQALGKHIWGGFIPALVKDGKHNRAFEFVFGIEHPTQDAVAQALATYMRTILSGDSLYDRADAIRRQKNVNTLTAEMFAAILKDDEVTAASLRDHINDKTPTRDEMPGLLAEGYKLFHGKAGCAECHRGPLLTDHDYHNIGLDNLPAGIQTGRSVHVPVGLKESRLNGAYRTPTLRNLLQTNPYFHDGRQATLRAVIDYYDDGVLPTAHLAAPLRDGDDERKLRLSPVEKTALVIFLRSLQGGQVDAKVARP